MKLAGKPRTREPAQAGARKFVRSCSTNTLVHNGTLFASKVLTHWLRRDCAPLFSWLLQAS